MGYRLQIAFAIFNDTTPTAFGASLLTPLAHPAGVAPLDPEVLGAALLTLLSDF
jgi:hypothetical protein